MVIRDKDHDLSVVREWLMSDAIGRNKVINTFVGLLNSIEDNSFIAIDGKWGSGKSVFVKQIDLLNYFDLNNNTLAPQGIAPEIIRKFQDKYIIYLYNAWENDHHDDPSQSLLFNLIGSFYTKAKMQEKAKAVSKKAVQAIFVKGVETLTQGIVNLSEISAAETIEDLVSEITTIDKRKSAVSKIIKSVVPEDKKLLLVIDELDRCAPNFAVKLLEAIKHYYNDDNIVFVISTNNSQLMHTVKKHYGEGFDGYGYLNKFYDLVFHLPENEIDDYITGQLKVPDSSYWKHIVPREVVRHFRFTMRETNRYYSSISLVMGYLGRERFFENNSVAKLTRYVFVPLALGLKIHNPEQYDFFINGKAEDTFREFFGGSPTLHHLVKPDGRSTEEQDPTDRAVEIYRLVLPTSSSNLVANYDIQELREGLTVALNLISSTAKLDESEV